MTKDQALLNAVVAQRDNALNALAEANAQIAVMAEQLQEMGAASDAAREQLAALQSRIDNIDNTLPGPPPEQLPEQLPQHLPDQRPEQPELIEG